MEGSPMALFVQQSLEKFDPVHHNGLRLAIRNFKISNNVNDLCEAGLTTPQNMRDTKTIVKAIRISANKKQPLSHHIRFPPFQNFYITLPWIPKSLDIRATHLFKEIRFRPIYVLDNQKTRTYRYLLYDHTEIQQRLEKTRISKHITKQITRLRTHLYS
jgi:hypothetical protein